MLECSDDLEEDVPSKKAKLDYGIEDSESEDNVSIGDKEEFALQLLSKEV